MSEPEGGARESEPGGNARRGDRQYWGTLAPIVPASLAGEMARQFESMGLRGVFAPQVYGPPWATLAAAATTTTRLEIASGIALAFARSPFETAMAAMDLDRLSGGRFILGLGPSVKLWNESYFGVEYGKPLEHLREVVAAVRHIVAGCASGDLQSFEGKYHRFDFTGFQHLMEPVRPEIPVWIAALRGPLIRLAAEIANGVMGHPIWSVKWTTTVVQDELKAGLAAAGRDRSEIHFNPWFWVAPSDDVSSALLDAKATVAFYAAAEQYEEYFVAHGFGDEARQLQAVAKAGSYLEGVDLVPEEMARTFVVVGTPDEVAEQLAPVWEFADSLCLVAPISAPPDRSLGYMASVAQTFYM